MELGVAFQNASIVAKLGMLIALVPVGVSLLYVVKPTERLLSLMRPLTLATLFGGLASFTSGVVAVLMGISATGSPSAAWREIAMGSAETFVALFVSFGALTIAWLLVAVGVRRTT